MIDGDVTPHVVSLPCCGQQANPGQMVGGGAVTQSPFHMTAPKGNVKTISWTHNSNSSRKEIYP